MANSAYRGLTIEVGANTSDAAQALRKIEKQAQGTTKELRQLQNALKVDPGNTDLIARQQDVYQRKLDVSRKKLEALRKLESQGQGAMSNEQWTSLQADIARTSQEISRYETQIKKLDITPQMDKARTAVQNTNKELEILDRRLQLDPSNTELVAQKQQSLEKAIKASKDQLELFKKTQESIGRENMSDAEWNDLESEIVDCEEALKRYEDELDKMAGKSKISVGHMTEAMSSVGDAIQQGSQKVASVGDTYTRTVSAGLVGAAVAGVKAAKDIDDALTSVRKTVDGTEEDYRALEEAAIEFSQTNAVSADTILELDALGAQLGFGISELKEFGEVASGLDIATDMSAEQAATEMAQFANITKMAHSDIRKYASTIVQLGNNMATTESKVSSMAQRVAAAGTQVGLTQDEILGWSAAMSSMGIEAEAGGSAFSTMIKNVNLAVQTGNDDLAKFAEMAGMSAEQFSEAWKTNASEAFTALLKGIGGAEDMTVALEKLGITEIRQSDMMARLAGNTDLVTQALGLANQGWNENMALGNEVANKNDSLSSKLGILVNRLKAVAIEIGEPLVDALCEALEAAEPLFEMIEDGAKAFNELDKEQQQAIISTLGMVAAVGPLLSATGRIGGAVGGAFKALGNLGTDLKLTFGSATRAAAEAGQEVPKLTGALSSLKAGAIGVGVAAAGMLVAFGIEQWVKYQEEIERTTKAHRTLADLEAEVANNGSDAANGVKEFAGIVVGYKSDLEAMTDTVRDLKDEAAEMGDSFVDGMKDVNVDTSVAEHYLAIIEEMTSKEQLNEVEKQKLKTAVEKYNEVTGDSIRIIDEEHGAIDRSTEAIKLHREEWRQAARDKVYQEQIAAATEQVVKAEQELPKANEILEQKKKRYAELNAELAENPTLWESYYWQINQASAEMDEAQKNVDALNQQISTNNKLVNDTISIQAQEDAALQATKDNVNALTDRIANMGDQTQEHMGKAGESANDLAARFDGAGIHAQDLANITDEQFAEMWASCEGKVELMKQKLDEYNGKPIEPKKVEVDYSDIETAVEKLGILGSINNRMKKLVEISYQQNGKPEGFAKGGVFSESLGVNSILTAPTLLSQGLFGEAGDEAVVSWPGGSAALPLTNKKALKPLSEAVADEVNRSSKGDSGTYNVINIDGTQWNNRAVTEETVEEFIKAVARKGNMNCG